MFSIFQKYLEEKIPLSEEELSLIESVVTIKKLRKKQFLLQEGIIDHCAFKELKKFFEIF